MVGLAGQIKSCSYSAIAPVIEDGIAILVSEAYPQSLGSNKRVFCVAILSRARFTLGQTIDDCFIGCVELFVRLFKIESRTFINVRRGHYSVAIQGCEAVARGQ